MRCTPSIVAPSMLHTYTHSYQIQTTYKKAVKHLSAQINFKTRSCGKTKAQSLCLCYLLLRNTNSASRRQRRFILPVVKIDRAVIKQDSSSRFCDDITNSTMKEILLNYSSQIDDCDISLFPAGFRLNLDVFLSKHCLVLI